MKNKEIEILKHMIEFYKKFCDGEEELNPIATGKEIKAIEKLLSYIEQLENKYDKALKFIKENSYKKGDGTIMYDVDIHELKNILKGDSDEFRNN